MVWHHSGRKSSPTLRVRSPWGRGDARASPDLARPQEAAAADCNNSLLVSINLAKNSLLHKRSVSHYVIFIQLNRISEKTRSNLTDCVPLRTEQATSLSWIRTPVWAHWIAALCHRVSDSHQYCQAALRLNKCCVAKVLLRVLIIAEVSRRQTRKGGQGPLWEPIRWFFKNPATARMSPSLIWCQGHSKVLYTRVE